MSCMNPTWGSSIRPISWTFNVTDRQKEVAFFENVLEMKILRHEEYDEPDELIRGKSSQTTLGYGPSHTHFTVVLNYNYNPTEYESGNDFLGLVIAMKNAIARAKALDWPIELVGDQIFRVCSPQGFPFFLLNVSKPTNCDPVLEVCLQTSYLISKVFYWEQIFGAKIFSDDENEVILCFGKRKTNVRFVQTTKEVVEMKEGHGYLSFSLPKEQLHFLKYACIENNKKLSSGLSSDGGVTLVFHDPDEHQLVFVDNETHSSMKTNEKASHALRFAMKKEVETSSGN